MWNADRLHFSQAVAAHLEESDLLRRAKPVLDASNHADRRVPVALERKDHVHEVLEQLGTRQGPVLGDVPHDDHAATRALGKTNEVKAAPPELGDRPGRRRHIRTVDELDRVDEHHGGTGLAGLLHDARDVALAEHEQSLAKLGGAACAKDWLEALGAQADLLRALLA